MALPRHGLCQPLSFRLPSLQNCWGTKACCSRYLVCVLVALSHVPLSGMDCSPPGYTVHAILLARKLERVPFPFPGYLPDPGIDPGSPALQVDSLPSQPPGKPLNYLVCGVLLQQLELRPLHVPTIVQLLSHVRLCETPWTIAHQASLSSTISWILLKLMSIELVMPSNHLILCCPHYQAPTTGLSYFLYVLSPLF